MLKHLYIQNFILIDQMHMDFEDGFSVFTGETGAGKSILIDAISVLSQSRASASFVSKGKEKAIIEGTFDLRNDTHACLVLHEAGFEINDETTFTREIYANGKSSARIDHRIVTQSLLKDVLRDEIDIHGQRDNTYLLNASNHIHLLDEYVNDEDTLLQVQQAFRHYDSLCKQKELALEETFNESDAEFFNYQIQEIEHADLKIGEDIELEEKEKKFKIVKDSFDKLNQIFSLYEDSVSNDLFDLNKMIRSLKADENIESIQNIVNDAYYSLSDAMEQLHQYFDSMDMSEDDINQMEERIFDIQKLKRKYGRTIEDILEKKESLQKQVEMITHRQEYLNEMDQKIADAKKIYDEKASKLSAVRKEKAKDLDQAILENLNDLMLPNAQFKTEIKPHDPSLYGADSVEFLISMNKGEELKPLQKTASGGELSRLMLGLKTIFSKLQGIQTVIFDEIDTGVSGPVASAIGKKMKMLSKDCQVFSVTHLAQVAACADQNYFVSKADNNEKTNTSVKLLNKEETIEQLAIIASGEITKASLSAAKELYKRNHS